MTADQNRPPDVTPVGPRPIDHRSLQVKRDDSKSYGRGISLWDPISPWPAARPWIWAALAVVVCCLQGSSFLKSLRPPPEGGDFFQEWASAKNAIRGLPVYTPQEISAQLYVGYDLKPGEVFVIRWNAHPPTSVLLALPFAYLSYSDATLAWNLISLAAFGASLALIAHGLRIRLLWWGVFPLITILLVCEPFRQQVNQAQLNPILLLLITGTWLAARSDRPRLAGVLLAGAVAIKLVPAFLFLLFILQRRYKLVIAGILGFATITIATATILGMECYHDYYLVVLPNMEKFRYMWANISLASWWLKLFERGAWHYDRKVEPLAHLFLLARGGALLSCGAVLLLWARFVLRVRTHPEQDYAFGLSLIVMLLLSPITWDHYFLLLVLPLAQMWIILPRTSLGNVLRFSVLAIACLAQSILWKVFLPEDLFLRGSVTAPLELATLLSYQCYFLIGLFFLSLNCFKIENK
jgi:hypothetical protein